MIIHTTNFFAGPLLLAAWAIDLYLFLAAVRLVCGVLRSPTAARACAALQPITDPIPKNIRNWLVGRWRGPVATWLPWLIVVAGGMFIRQLLVWTALSLA